MSESSRDNNPDFGISQIKKYVDNAQNAIAQAFPKNLFQWQLIEARHLLRGVSDLKVVELAANSKLIADRYVDVLLPITEYWKTEAEKIKKLHTEIAQLYSESCPANLRDLSFEETVSIIKSARQQHIGVSYVLPLDLVDLLLAQPDISYENFSKLLISHKEHIIEITSSKLFETQNHERFAERSKFLLEAIDCFKQGQTAAAQVLAIVVLDSHILDVEPISGKSTTSTSTQLKERLEHRKLEEIEELNGWLSFYECVTFLPIEKIFSTNNRTTKLSRHGTVHYISTNQVNEANFLRSLLASSSVVVHDSLWC